MDTQEEKMGMGMENERNQGRSNSNSNESSQGSNYSTGNSQQTENKERMHACHAGKSTEMGEQSTTQQTDGNNTRR